MEINCENGLTSDRLEDGEGRSQDALYEDVVVVEMSMAAERLRKNSINRLVKRGKAGPTGSGSIRNSVYEGCPMRVSRVIF